MNLSHAYDVAPSKTEAIKLLHGAFDLGVRHFDTAALYGFGSNESLIGEALKQQRSEIFLASKCAMTGVDGRRVIDGRPETLLKTVDEALQRLQTDYIDLYYLHRWDKSVPIEDSMGAMVTMKQQGKIGAIGLSEVSANTLSKAQKIHPIAAVQTEYSLWSRNPELGILDTCIQNNTALVAFSPLGRGFLAGAVDSPEQFKEKDIRANMPRFQEPNFSKNKQWLKEFKLTAAQESCSPAQLALAWVLNSSPVTHAIPGTRSLSHLRENIAATEIKISTDALDKLNRLINQNTVSGPRYPQATQKEIDTEEF
ncbi:MAG: aldo/keto reductase [Cellvibrionaceae bacterium]|nr:aldo/keto reductase [Cellvibrionaceae bacterium]